MKKYKLKKDTIFYKAGTVCKLTPRGNLVLDDCEGTCVVSKHKLEKFPELLDEWFEKIEEKKYGGRVPKRWDVYWYIYPDGSIFESTWTGVITDIGRFESGSAFWTRKEAEKELECRKAWTRLKDKGFKFEWFEETDRGELGDFTIYAHIEPDYSQKYEEFDNDLNILFGGEE